MAFTKVTAAGINTGGSFVLENINTSGIITASAVNVGSAVTISSSGANVTGIVTAGTVQVGSATTIHTTGIDLGGGTLTSHNINSTGIITATSGFDGNLTGNVTGDLTGNVTGNVSSSGANTLGSLTVTNDATVGGALTVTGDFTVNGTTTTIDTIVTAVDSLAVDGNVTAGGNLNITGVSTFNGTTEVQDSSFKVTNSNASGQYLQVTQNTNSSLNLDKVGDGAFYIRGNNIYLQNDGTSETYAGFEADGTSYLNYNGSTKLETTGTGVTITGDARVTGILTVGTASVTIDGSQDFPTIRPTLDLNFAATKTLDRRITFTRDSIATYTDELGIIRTAPNNVPRFDHDPETGESLGLLIEESRTNTVTRSEDWTVGWTDFEVTDTANAATAPDGTDTATKIVADNTNAEHFTQFPSLTSSTNTYYTYSVFCKSAELSSVAINVSASRLYATFNLATGVIITSGSNGTDFNNHSATITSYPNGWFRLTLTGQSLRNTSSEYVRVALSNSSTNILNSGGTWQGDGTSGLYFWGAQYEQGSFPTSYIPTSGSTVTRAADLAKITGTNFTEWYNASEGTIFLEDTCQNPSNDWTNVVAFKGNDYNNQLLFFKNWAGVYNIFEVYSNGAQSVRLQYDANVGQTYKICNAYKLDDFASSVSGQIQTDTSAVVPTVNRLEFGCTSSPSSFSVSYVGHIKQLTYYNKRLTNAQLQSLTRQ